MGREWYLNWVTKSSSKKVNATSNGGSNGGADGGSGGRIRVFERKSTTPPAAAVATAPAASTVGQCLNSVLHLFDFQHFHQLCLLHSEDRKGLEAPRNSLASISEEEKNYYSLHIHIKTNRSNTEPKIGQVPRGKTEDFTSESSNSHASPRTPNLIARLMGLDTLPDSNTTTTPHIKTPPSPTTTTTKTTLMRRRSMEVVDHHRYSLQINKENSIVKEMELSRPSFSGISTNRKDGKTMSRRVGMDITNTIVKARDHHRRDEYLLTSITTTTRTTTKEAKPKRKFRNFDENNDKIIRSKSDHKLVKEDKELSRKMIKKPLKSYDSIRSKKDEQFVTVRPSNSTMDMRRKKRILSSELDNGKVTSFVSLKKDNHSKLLDKQGVSSRVVDVEPKRPMIKNTTMRTATTTTTRRLSRYPRQRKSTLEEATLAPADENKPTATSVMDEQLADILKPYIKHDYHPHNHRVKHHYQQINGFQLVKILCSKIRSFSGVNCQTLQDIGALVEKDVPNFGAANNVIVYQDESEEIVSEIEEHVLNSLVHEICCLS